MDKVALLDAGPRSELFEQSALQRGINPAIVEKDFWVCWVLKKLFESDLAEHLVFKGGTSLSKVYGIIDRFSEDIDLVLNWELLGYGKNSQDPWEGDLSAKQLKRFNERAANYIDENLLPHIAKLLAVCSDVKLIISTKDPQIIEIHYPAAFKLAALRPEIQLEIGPLASWVPSGEHTIRPYAADDFPNVFDDPNCPVIAINAERTFWEKATILHQQAHRVTEMPPHYSRHYYDLYRLADSPIKTNAFNDIGQLEDVVSFKMRFYRSQWAKYELAKPGTFRLLPSAEGEKELRADYAQMLDHIFGEKPEWDTILDRLSDLEAEINGIENL